MGLLLLLLSLLSPSQVSNPEQVAFDHFLANELKTSYNEYNKIYFSGSSEASTSISKQFCDCFPNNKDFMDFCLNENPKPTNHINIKFEETKTKKVTNKVKRKGINLQVYRAIYAEDAAYVHLTVYRYQQFVDHYLYKISLHDEGVIESCKRSEII